MTYIRKWGEKETYPGSECSGHEGGGNQLADVLRFGSHQLADLGNDAASDCPTETYQALLANRGHDRHETRTAANLGLLT
jgi:hypothetical protein